MYVHIPTCFNPRVLAGGRDWTTQSFQAICNVSIHASLREDATSKMYRQSCAGLVSIHASSREDATSQPCATTFGRSFQSTRPRGRTRHFFQFIMIDFIKFQSTRPRGRTRQVRSARTLTRPSFNPRVLAGGRDLPLIKLLVVSRFQSTRPRGRTRLAPPKDINHLHQFQSTRPRGRTRP